ncbi:beta-lactamase/transpeptidase-like protein [Pseudomassariella vexata]|uniref:Beta-lactamase/transpeptidase-like protein n=1 Tax=Pseudomassariella vexata TaxID=1141098 RepID=A0A1Y2EFA4_9PEZI|nr:beta-lactamase/transpeptidase-like protein [Pseudomassariella vexata]ORY70268.1 beta-lactamase/transpeptidase-like protein [Pseudomassariella vexata]
MHALFTILSVITLIAAANGQAVYQPCPILRAYYPAPTIDKNSKTIQSFTQDFTDLFDQLIAVGGSEDFGPITPNTTSFSVILFSGAENAEEDPVFFEYQHTAIESQEAENVTNNTVFPVGTLTQLFTVYTWLAEIGDESWDAPITQFLPEITAAASISSDFSVNWDKVTVGSLAGHISGIARDSHACTIGTSCDKQKFLDAFASKPAVFLPDTTPMISNAAFQLLAFALESQTSTSFCNTLSSSILNPLNMSQTGLLSNNNKNITTTTTNPKIFGNYIDSSMSGEQPSLSLYTTSNDLARFGHSILSSKLLSASQTRRWLQPIADTSNLRNGVGRPWEVYHAGQYANSSILDVYTKTGAIGQYSSYFGLVPDFNAGFAILAHDTDGIVDLNVYADLVSLALLQLEELAAKEMAARYAGTFVGDDEGSLVVLNVTDEGPGLVVTGLEVNGIDLRAEAADAAGIDLEDLDFRLYPSNVAKDNLQQFMSVFQDRSAPADMGTPTCITWMDTGSVGAGAVERFIFEVDESGMAVGLRLSGKEARFTRQV